MKRCVLRFLLNESTEGEVLSSDGSEFHQVGPMEQNARSPYVTDRVIGTFSSMPAERRPSLAVRYWIRSWRYWGAGPCSVLYTSSVTLYCIRDVIGSQWSSRRTGVIWSYLRVPVRRRAAALCVFVCVCVRAACMRACVRACVRAYVRVCVGVCAD